MIKIQQDELSKYFFLGLVLAILTLSFLVIKPYINAILASMVLAFLAYPIYLKLVKKTNNKNFSAFIVSTMMILILAVPLIFVANSIRAETFKAYESLSLKLDELKQNQQDCEEENCSKSVLDTLVSNKEVGRYLDTGLSRVSSSVIEAASAFLFSLPSLLINILIAIFGMFFFLRDGDLFIQKAQGFFPIKKSHQSMIVKKLNETAQGVIYGQILLAILQGTVGAVGFFFFGMPSPILWGIAMAICALIPFIGTGIIWFPAGSYILIQGVLNSDSGLIWKGIGLLIYGALFISSIDNILKPKIIGDKANVHPFIVMIGAIGGLSLFGFIGFIIGPIILSTLIVVLNIYEREKHEITG